MAKKIDIYIEIALIFMLGILAGVALKVEANKFIMIGFDDYKMKFSENQYKINILQKKIDAAVQEKENFSSENQIESEQEDLDDSQSL